MYILHIYECIIYIYKYIYITYTYNEKILAFVKCPFSLCLDRNSLYKEVLKDITFVSSLPNLNPNLALNIFLVLIKLSHSTGFIFFTCKIKQIYEIFREGFCHM